MFFNFKKTTLSSVLILSLMAPLQNANAATYEVKKNDTLSSIALKHNTSVDNIKKENGLKNDKILIGQKLNINNLNIKLASFSVKNGVVKVNGALNVRKGAGTNYGVLTTVKNGQNVKVLKEQNGFYQVQYGNVTGWVSKKYINITSSNSNIASTQSSSTNQNFDGVVKVNGALNVRKGAGTNYGVLTTVKNGQNVKVLKEQNGFYQIQYGNVTGWVSKSYVNKKTVTSNAANTQNSSTNQNFDGVVKVNGALNVRKGAGTNYGVLTTVKNGQNVRVIKEQNGFYQIQYGDVTGWVSKSYVEKKIIQVSNQTTKDGYIKVDTSVNIRSGAGTNFSVIGYAKNNQTVKIMSEKNGFYEVQVGSIKGFVSKQYVIVGKISSNSAETVYKTKKVSVSNSLNVRGNADVNSALVGSLKNGELVEVIQVSGIWSKIRKGNINGWVQSKYLIETYQNNQTKNKTITIDPGHGGWDPGSVSDSGIKESTLTWQISQRVKSELESQGYKVALTRTENDSCIPGNNNTSSDLSCRVKVADSTKSDLFISIHINKFSLSTARGMETYYYLYGKHPNDSLKLATLLHKNTLHAFGTWDRGVKSENFQVVRTANVPSVLVEVGFLSNSTDLNSMMDYSKQVLYAKSFAEGINEYFK